MAARKLCGRQRVGAGRAGPQAGFTYIGLLVVVAIIGLALVKVSDVWVTVAKREKEQQLLWAGAQYRQALTRYYMAGLGERYPHKLEDLLQDPRAPNVRRYLRQLYPDPMTGRVDWGLTKVGDLITGVYSTSDAEPLKKAGFDMADASFADKGKYSDWVFTPRFGRAPAYVPATPAAPGTGAPPAAGQAPGGFGTQPNPLQPNSPLGGPNSPTSPLFRTIPGPS